MGLVNDIKNQVKNSGINKGKFIYFKPGVKVRIRFRQDMDDGMKVLFHDSYAQGINVPCQEIFGKKCKYCNNDELRHRDSYIWSVYDYEAKEDKLLLSPVNNCTPIPALVGMYDTYGTITDRDYVITRNGTQQQTTYSVVPMDKVSFKNNTSKPFSESKIISLLKKAFSDEVPVDEDEDEDEEPKKKAKKSKVVVEEDEDETTDYEEMSSKELYKLCLSRDLKVKPKKDAEYYIEKLEEADEKEDSDDDDDEWDD
jgi:hypothetical protein